MLPLNKEPHKLGERQRCSVCNLREDEDSVHFMDRNLVELVFHSRPRIIFLLLFSTIVFACYCLNPQYSTKPVSTKPEISKFIRKFPSADSKESQNHEETTITSAKEGYLVWSPSCRIPDFDPYHKSIKKLVKKMSLVRCSSLPPLTRVINNKLIYDENLAVRYSGNKSMMCNYRNVKRTSVFGKKLFSPDDEITIDPAKKIRKTVVILTDDQECLMVNCYIKTKAKKRETVYENMHARIINKPKVEEKIKSRKKFPDDKLSILIFGIDSISRLNLLRTMPKTINFLNKNNFIELKGYNKIDDNTFPNLMGILTGRSLQQIKNTCWATKNTEIDHCPLLWYNASKLGYVTLYVEDEPNVGTFNYYKKGFKEQPTDYYFRPFMLAAQKQMRRKSFVDYLHACLGSASTSDYILNYAKDFINYFKNDLYFALFWLNNFSHNNLNRPSSMDRKILDFFNSTFVSNNTLLNSTMVIFLSDHGLRFGRIRETYVGWFEERLPFIYFWLPEWYRNKYSDNYKNLLKNTNRLTSPFDLHLTLKDLIFKNTNYTQKKHTSDACPDCRSLFQEIPWNRSCEAAGITEHWCTCSNNLLLSNEDAFIKNMAKFAVKEINLKFKNVTSYLPNSNKSCANLILKNVLGARLILNYNNPDVKNKYLIQFETLPGHGKFETTLTKKHGLKIVDSVSRINVYGDQSHCVSDSDLKKYCFCCNKTIN